MNFIKRTILWALYASGVLTVVVEHKADSDPFTIEVRFLGNLVYVKTISREVWQRSYIKGT